MLQFLYKPPLELCKCFGVELKRAYREYYLFEVMISDVIGDIIGKVRRQFFPSFHAYLLGIRDVYEDDLSGFLSYAIKKIVCISWWEWSTFDPRLTKIELLAEDESVMYAYKMG